MQRIQGIQRRVSILSGGCRGIRKGFPEQRQQPNPEAEQAGARQVGVGRWRGCGEAETGEEGTAPARAIVPERA